MLVDVGDTGVNEGASGVEEGVTTGGLEVVLGVGVTKGGVVEDISVDDEGGGVVAAGKRC